MTGIVRCPDSPSQALFHAAGHFVHSLPEDQCVGAFYRLEIEPDDFPVGVKEVCFWWRVGDF